MKTRTKLDRGLWAVLAALVFTVACSGGGGDDGKGGGNDGPAPAIVRFTSSPATIVAGGSSVLTAEFTNGTAVIEPGVGAVTSNVPVTVQPSTTTVYTLTVTGTAGRKVTANTTVTVTVPPVDPPEITAQPQSTTVVAGATATFSVAATGTGTLSYQWQKDEASITGATASALTLADVGAEDAGSYRVVVTNTLDGTSTSTTSESAPLLVNLPPTIAAQPLAAKVAAGHEATFSVSATGVGTLSYQWEKDGAALPGATSSALVIPSVQAADAGSYRVAVTSTLNGTTATTTSAAATLTLATCTWNPVRSEPLDALPLGATFETGMWENPRVDWIEGQWAWHQASETNGLRIPLAAGSISSWFEVEVDVHVPARAQPDPLGDTWNAWDIILGVFRSETAGVEARVSIPPNSSAPTFAWASMVGGVETVTPSEPIADPSGGWHTFTLLGNRDTCELRLLVDGALVSEWSGDCDLSGAAIELGSTNPQAQWEGPGIAWTQLNVSAGDDSVCMTDQRLRIIPRNTVARAGGEPVVLSAIYEGMPVAADWAMWSDVGSLSATTGEAVEYLPPATLEAEETVLVSATMGEVMTVATIVVTPESALTVSPATATVEAGGDLVIFEATLKNATGEISWALTPEVGSLFLMGGNRVSYTPPADVAEATQVTLTATGAGLSGSALITVVAPPASLTVTPEEARIHAGGDAVRFTATLERGTGPVTWTLSPEIGTLSASTGDFVDYQPPAAWNGPPSTVTVTASAVGVTATAQVTVGESYDVEVVEISPLTPSQRAAFEAARQRIQGFVTFGLYDIPLETVLCREDLATTGAVDDLRILVRIAPLDGPGNVLGQAGPCIIRGIDGIPVVGFMNFDSADIDEIEADGQLESVILHEMLHVLGLGTMWGPQGFALLAGADTSDPHFVGPRARAAFTEFNGGHTYASGSIVPVENTGGEGTALGHWRETVFGRELMTGWLSGTTQPLSRTTIESFADLGYHVDPLAADPFDIGAAFLRRDDGPVLDLAGERLVLPTSAVDEDGTLVPLTH